MASAAVVTHSHTSLAKDLSRTRDARLPDQQKRVGRTKQTDVHQEFEARARPLLREAPSELGRRTGSFRAGQCYGFHKHFLQDDRHQNDGW